MNSVNIFTRYEQRENSYTNGFMSLLSFLPLVYPQFVNHLLNDHLGLSGVFNPVNFLVLSGIESYVDGEVSASDFCVWIETKIVSGTLCTDQLHRHLKMLEAKPQRRRYLVLLTPDDSSSSYIKRFLEINPCIRHLAWRNVYDLLESLKEQDAGNVLFALVQHYLAHIKETIFEQDLAGGILKINFGKKSGVHEDSYLDEIKVGKWPCWNSPRQYKSLDGTGRKLLLYDRTRQGITVEAEIAKVFETNEPDYPWTNEIISWRIFDTPIPIERIRPLKYFQDFGVHRKDRSAFRNLTREQYRLLVDQT